MNSKYKQTFIFIAIGLLAIILSFGFWMSHKYPPKYSSKQWKSVTSKDVISVTLLPIQDKYYSQAKTIDKPLEIKEKDIIKSIVSTMDGKFEWWDYLGGKHWTHLKDFNIKIETVSKKTYIFKYQFYIDDSFIWYSELYPESYSKPGDLQETYGDIKASGELAKVIDKLIVDNNICWVPAYKEK